MSDPVVIFDHVFKKFSRGEQHTSLRDFIPAMAARLMPWGKKKSDPLTLAGEEFWAVKDVSFELKKGQSLGIIGPNGSGKSTTLKLLSGILRPDQGRYSVKGRLSALIEVGAGFHPDLTGRENVFLNGCILGMSRKEVAAKFNEIVEFAGVQEFIDTPVKRYSSGMAVRLGFAVAAHIDPDVLLVDEVLAVGDMEFRQRCHARMERMRKNGVTMILVSHNLNEVRNLCENTIMLFKGEVLETGPTQKVLEKYYNTIAGRIKGEQDRESAKYRMANADSPVVLHGAHFLDDQGQPAETLMTGRPMTLRIKYEAKQRVERPVFRVELMWATDDFLAATFNTAHDGYDLGPIEGVGHLDLCVSELLVEPNVFAMRVSVGDSEGHVWDRIPRVRFVIAEEKPIPGVFSLPHGWAQPTVVDEEPAQPAADNGSAAKGASAAQGAAA